MFEGRSSMVFRVDVVALISSCFKRNKKSREVKVLTVLDYMFHGSCRKVSFGMRNRVERFLRDYERGIENLNLFLNLFKLYYQTVRNEVDKDAYPDTIFTFAVMLLASKFGYLKRYPDSTTY